MNRFEWKYVVPVLCMLTTACAPILTLPMHQPLYPVGEGGETEGGSAVEGQQVTYTITASSRDGIKRIRFYERWDSINNLGVNPATNEGIEIGSRSSWDDVRWSEQREYPGNSSSVTWTFTRGPYPQDTVVQYRFEVKADNFIGYTRSHIVGFATRPYPVEGIPAPVYVQALPEDVFDVVFIADRDLNIVFDPEAETDPVPMENFQARSTSMITDALFKEPTLKYLKRQLNFYINPEAGKAISSPDDQCHHETPSNWANLSTYEAKPILHEGSFRNYKCPSTDILSVNMNSIPSMRHEMGHEFGMYDEYEFGEHVNGWPFPNNWDDEESAKFESYLRGRGPYAVEWIATETDGTEWFKICDDNCAMESTMHLHPFEKPCTHRVIYNVLINPDSDEWEQ